MSLRLGAHGQFRRNDRRGDCGNCPGGSNPLGGPPPSEFEQNCLTYGGWAIAVPIADTPGEGIQVVGAPVEDILGVGIALTFKPSPFSFHSGWGFASPGFTGFPVSQYLKLTPAEDMAVPAVDRVTGALYISSAIWNGAITTFKLRIYPRSSIGWDIAAGTLVTLDTVAADLHSVPARLATLQDGTVVAVWPRTTGSGIYNLFWAKSANHGLTWTAPAATGIAISNVGTNVRMVVVAGQYPVMTTQFTIGGDTALGVHVSVLNPATGAWTTATSGTLLNDRGYPPYPAAAGAVDSADPTRVGITYWPKGLGQVNFDIWRVLPGTVSLISSEVLPAALYDVDSSNGTAIPSLGYARLHVNPCWVFGGTTTHFNGVAPRMILGRRNDTVGAPVVTTEYPGAIGLGAPYTIPFLTPEINCTGLVTFDWSGGVFSTSLGRHSFP